MSVIVTDAGFVPDDWSGGFAAPDEAAQAQNPATALDLPGDTDPAALTDRIGGVAMIRVSFPGFSDGRGFTLARRLRQMGFAGRLRAAGHVLADQYAMARRVGFDEVEISDDQARRQPEADWLARADWRMHDYQTRLRAG